MSEDYELGTYSRDSQILRIDEMYDGVAIEEYRSVSISVAVARFAAAELEAGKLRSWTVWRLRDPRLFAGPSGSRPS